MLHFKLEIYGEWDNLPIRNILPPNPPSIAQPFFRNKNSLTSPQNSKSNLPLTVRKGCILCNIICSIRVIPYLVGYSEGLVIAGTKQTKSSKSHDYQETETNNPRTGIRSC